MVAQGTTLAGRYRLDTRIGAGGMGEVWRGEDVVLARTVAVKVLLPGRTDDPGFVARFQGEARAMATINHPGVVDVYDYGVDQIAGAGATAYLVMKFVDGEALDRLLARLGHIAPEPAMELIAQAASALQAVHERGIVHRDVKPGNLLVQRDGTLVITDFGIARADVASRLTDVGMVLGTAAYCAPEQAEGAPVTPAVDIYALGVVAYECLVGQRPFDGDSPVTIALKHIREAPPALPLEIPAPVRALVERALLKDPARRFPSAAAMATAARQTVLPGHEGAVTGLTPVTGATMAPAYSPGPGTGPETGMVHGTPEHTTLATPGGAPAPRRGRRAAKARRRGGLIAGIAVVSVLGVGAGAMALTGMTLGPGPPSVEPTGLGAGSVFSPPPVTTRPPRTPPKSPRPTDRQSPPPRQVTEEPEPTPTKDQLKASPSPSPSKTPTPTPTPTPKPTRAVPKVVELPYPEARSLLLKAGFTIKTDDQGQGSGVPCRKVGETIPNGGTMAEVGSVVKVVLIEDVCPTPSNTPSQGPSNKP